MISGKWFRRRFLHKITHNSIKNRGSTPIVTNLVGVHPKNIHTKFEGNPCSGSREVNNGILHSDIPCRVGSVGSVSASHTVGREFASRPGHTKDHHKNGTNCIPA